MSLNANEMNEVTDLCDLPWGKSLSMLIVEDHEFVRDGLHRLVARVLGKTLSSITVNFASSLEGAAQIVRSSEVGLDLILLDLELEDATAIDCVALIKNEWGGQPVVVVSACDDWALVAELMTLGILGFIPKRSNVDVISSAIRLIAAGGRYFPEEVILLRPSEGDERGTEASREKSTWRTEIGSISEDLMKRFSPRQQAVFSLMVEGMSNKEIARMLSLSVGTTKNYVSAILRVLGVTTRSAAIRMAMTLTSTQSTKISNSDSIADGKRAM